MSAEARRLAGDIDGSGLSVAIARARYNIEISDGLLEGARELCARVGVTEVTVFDVAGSFELPLAAQHLARAGHDAVVALGAVIEGETDHYEHIAHRASEGLMRVMLDTGVPIGFGILTVADRDQAKVRSAPGEGNKGAEAALAAIEMAVLLRSLGAR